MTSNLMTFAREFAAICAYLQKKHPEQRTADSLYVEQAELVRLLDKNKYEEAATKLVVWRNLQWIDCEPDRFSRKTRHMGKQVRMMHLRLSVWTELQRFFAGNSAGNTS